ncbi:MAG: hypothetical protein JSR98_20130 [Proteobacteria bacterium]|nr:hypothetical protein [Pseudomonadota bacterium]
MGKSLKVPKTIPDHSENPSIEPWRPAQAPRAVIKAGAAAVAHWERLNEQARRELEAEAAERARAEKLDSQRAVDQAVRVANDRGEDVVRRPSGAAEVARDGLKWLFDKGTLFKPHYEAGLRFRGDYELAMGTGVISALADPGALGGSFGPKSGPTDRMLGGRDRMNAALKALGSPMLIAYVKEIAGEGRMLTDPVFVKRPDQAREHVLPARIAYDLLARHYGMIR